VTNLKVLLLGSVEVTDAGYAALTNLPLERLYLSDQGSTEDYQTGIGDEGLAHVGRIPTLTYLDLSGSRVTDAGMARLQRVPALKTLVLDRTRVQGGGLAALQTVGTLRHLSLDHTAISGAGVDALSALTAIDSLSLQNIRISQSDLLRLQSAVPSVKLRITQAAESRPKQLDAGTIAPDFSARMLDGRTWRLSDQRGKTVLLYFWAMWCGPCVEGTPELQRLESELRSINPDFEMLSLSMDDIDTRVRLHVEKHGLTWPQAVIGRTGPIVEEYRIIGAPTLFLIGPDGTLVSVTPTREQIVSEVRRLSGQEGFR
jgi:peroxiredoxin